MIETENLPNAVLPKSPSTLQPTTKASRRPRLGFVGVGWIGRHRLEGVRKSELAEISSFFDPAAPGDALPGIQRKRTLEELLASDLDGVVIATPNALHAEQTLAALRAGKAVFCQKPLARTSDECRRVLVAAQQADRNIGVDFSYRFCRGMQRIRDLIDSGALGKIYGIELKFHNAYGPDKPWFYDRALSGGGCLLDLGVHLLDLVFWLFPGRECASVASQLYRKGECWTPRPGANSSAEDTSVEDYVAAQFRLENGPAIQLVCSWRAPAGRDAEIEATFFGTQGGARFENLNGSFFDFRAERYFPDRSRETLAEPPEDWGAGAILHWVRQIDLSPRYDPSAESLLRTAEVIDQIYASV
ncbi:MAG TPA: Gfo/Idh/MocA family oxidoreductase [Opitutaceae bacterium]|nr:Gfo/Idh/MocA family oxidoreductase [Opitutaceae bacterium]